MRVALKNSYLGGVIAFGMTAMLHAQPAPPRAVRAHEVPVPTTVSPKMQERIARPDHKWPETFPTTNAGWKQLDNPDPVGARASLTALLDEFGLQLEQRKYGGVDCYELTPLKLAKENRKRLLVHIHGGGYVLGAGERGLKEAVLVAGISGIKTISIDYRMPPEFPFPVPIDDVVSAWKAIHVSHKTLKIGIFGNSAGGAMALGLVQRAVQEKFPLPRAIVSATPWADLSETGDSYFTNKYMDPIPYHGILNIAANQYAGGMDLKDPRLSPVYGEFSGFPPTLLLSGNRDLFLSNAIRVDRKIRDAGRDSTMILYEGQSHGRHLAGWEYPETRTTLRDISLFWERHLK